MTAILHNKGDEKMGKEDIEEMQFKEGIQILIRMLQMRGLRETLKTIILHSMVRHIKPHTIVEVGSGVSPFFSVNALSINKSGDGTNSKMICIDPYPQTQLKKIQGDCQIQLIPVQDIDSEFFKVLDAGDILFSGSSHTVKIARAVNFLLLDVLPNLNKGVVIHIHDIPFPYPTLNLDCWIFRAHQFWTESALLQAFKICDPKRHFPSSIWLQKVR